MVAAPLSVTISRLIQAFVSWAHLHDSWSIMSFLLGSSEVESIAHWCRDVVMLTEIQIVYVIDRLGFGTSDELAGCVYMMAMRTCMMLRERA